jgi:hypothetical protein
MSQVKEANLVHFPSGLFPLCVSPEFIRDPPSPSHPYNPFCSSAYFLCGKLENTMKFLHIHKHLTLLHVPKPPDPLKISTLASFRIANMFVCPHVLFDQWEFKFIVSKNFIFPLFFSIL